MNLACEADVCVQNENALRFSVASERAPLLEYIKSISSLVGAAHILAVFEEKESIKIFFDDKKCLDTFIKSGIHVNGHHVKADYVVPPGKKIVLSNIDPIVSNCDLMRLLSVYGQIMSPVIRPPISDDAEYCHIDCGVRFVYMILNGPIPDTLDFKYGDQLYTFNIQMEDNLSDTPYAKVVDFESNEELEAATTCSSIIRSSSNNSCDAGAVVPFLVSVEDVTSKINSAQHVESISEINSAQYTKSVSEINLPQHADSILNNNSYQHIDITSEINSAQYVKNSSEYKSPHLIVPISENNSSQFDVSKPPVRERNQSKHKGQLSKNLRKKHCKLISISQGAKRKRKSNWNKFMGVRMMKDFIKRKEQKNVKKIETPCTSPLVLKSLSPSNSFDRKYCIVSPLLNDNFTYKSSDSILEEDKLQMFIQEVKHQRSPLEYAIKYLGTDSKSDVNRLIVQLNEYNKGHKDILLKLRIQRLIKSLEQAI